MSLYNKIIDLQKLSAAWKKVRKNRPAAGVDNVTCEQFDENQRVELKQLNEELKAHSYEPLPVKSIMLYKGEKVRQIALYTMRDKTVQQSVAAELNKIYDPLLSERTFAYRYGKSALNAIDLVAEQMASGTWKYILKLDIASFFDRIQWPVLNKILSEKIQEEDVLELIRKDIQVAYMEATGEMTEKKIGVHQGSGISPVISNIYLKDFDHWLSTQDIYFIRYSDDILLLGKEKEQLLGLLSEIKIKLNQYGLEINEKKQALADVTEGVDFLGYHISRSGKAIPAKAEQSLEERLELMWLTIEETDIETKIKKAAEIVGGWEQYFREERRRISIFEYVTLIALAGNDQEKVRQLEQLRFKTENIYKDIMQYLSGFWKDRGCQSLELLEYEQYFCIYHKREQNIPDSEKKRALTLYRSYLINPSEEEIIELMQLYTDWGEYDKASYWMEKKEEFIKKFKRYQTSMIDVHKNGELEDISWDKETLTRYLRYLVGREDIHALETIDAGNRRKNEFQSLPLTEKVLARHLSGECTAATYVQRSNSTVRYLVVDVDISKKIIMQYGTDSEEFRAYLKKTAEWAQQITKLLSSLGMQGYIEYSGYRGYHIWIFFTEWIPVRYVNLLTDILESSLNITDEHGISMEFFPNKTRLKPGKFGQAIKLPYGIHSKTGERSYFIDEDGSKVVELNPFLDTLAKVSLRTIKKVLATNTGYKEEKSRHQLEENLEAFEGSAENALEILKKCNLMRYLCQKAVRTGYLTHFERLSVLYVFGHLGGEGREFVHKVMSFTLNYQYNTTEKFIRRCPEKPISCVKLRDQYKKITAEFGCSCIFKRTKNCYPSPVMHAISRSNDLQEDITLPTSRTITKEKKQKVFDEINIHKKALELAKRILDYKKQKRSIDKNIQKVEKELSAIYEDAGVDVLEIEMGMLVRRKKEDGYEWLIEL